MGYVVYIAACADGTLYTGIATDPVRRLRQHNGELVGGARYTAARRPVVFVYTAAFPSRSAAQSEERRIKALSRAGKEALIAASASSVEALQSNGDGSSDALSE